MVTAWWVPLKAYQKYYIFLAEKSENSVIAVHAEKNCIELLFE